MNEERFATLTESQRLCLRLYAKPMRAKEIAAELNLSVRTIEGHLARATERLNANSTVQAARELAAYEAASGYKLPEYNTPIDPSADMPPSSVSGVLPDTAPTGRNIRFGIWQRTVIIFALTAALLLSFVAIVAGSEGVTRLARAYYSNAN